MIKPISCPRCKSALAWYDTNTGCLEQYKPAKVFGAFLTCSSAGCETVSYKFDGAKTARKMRAQVRPVAAPPAQVPTEPKPSLGEALSGCLQTLKLALDAPR
ncbi:MAG TPA: hypothetical protein VIL74_08960 [Pyrinomonadaceae bacterium]|jgi:hypothetical protein